MEQKPKENADRPPLETERRVKPDRRALPMRREQGQRSTDRPKAAEVQRQADAELARAELMLKIAQVARMANVSPRTVWNDIQKGALMVERRLVNHRYRTRVPIAEARRYAHLTTPPAETR